ncbi:MAG: hypothetical protein GIW95_05115 [Candidatus Eremiobacteraeota bacterium]|nr:hypothetical protein [Candidatus Eremiobacteraeota bacterium]
METAIQVDYAARCERVAAVAHDAGMTIAKVPAAFAVVASCNGSSVSFPIVSDERDWRETTAQEAFFCAVTDAFAWAAARPGETAFATLDAIESSEIPQIKRDLEQQLGRIRSLISLMGGQDGVRRLWVAAGIDPDAAASVNLS